MVDRESWRWAGGTYTRCGIQAHKYSFGYLGIESLRVCGRSRQRRNKHNDLRFTLLLWYTVSKCSSSRLEWLAVERFLDGKHSLDTGHSLFRSRSSLLRGTGRQCLLRIRTMRAKGKKLRTWWPASRHQSIHRHRSSTGALAANKLQLKKKFGSPWICFDGKEGHLESIHLYSIHYLFGLSIFVGGGNDNSYGMRKRRPYSATKGGDSGKPWVLCIWCVWLIRTFSDPYWLVIWI